MNCNVIMSAEDLKNMNNFIFSVYTVLMEDYEVANHILALDDPRGMKQQGRYVRNFDQNLWDENCQAIVEKGNVAKVYLFMPTTCNSNLFKNAAMNKLFFISLDQILHFVFYQWHFGRLKQ